VGRDTSRLFSEVEDSVCRSSRRSSNVANDGAESGSLSRKPVGSHKRSGLSDASGNASRLLSKTGDSVGCSSLTSSTVAEELVARVLRETSKAELYDGEDSREGRRARSEACRVSEARGGSGTANKGSEIVNGKDSETAESKDPEIVASAGPRDSRHSIFVDPEASADHEDSETVTNEDSGDGIDSNEGADLRSEDLRSSDEVDNSKTVTGEDLVKARDLSANKASSNDERSSSSNREFAGSRTRS